MTVRGRQDFTVVQFLCPKYLEDSGAFGRSPSTYTPSYESVVVTCLCSTPDVSGSQTSGTLAGLHPAREQEESPEGEEVDGQGHPRQSRPLGHLLFGSSYRHCEVQTPLPTSQVL